MAEGAHDDGNRNSLEAKLELKALHKSIHRPMRKWYNGGKDSEMLNKEYGEFPLFYQELAEWPHFTKVMQLFEEFTEASSSKQEEEKQESTPGATDEPEEEESGHATGRSGKDEADGAIARWEREKKGKSQDGAILRARYETSTSSWQCSVRSLKDCKSACSSFQPR